MLTEICQDLRNWFDRYMPKWYGTFEIKNHELVLKDDMTLQEGQYFRIVGSVFNDGVHQYGMGNLIWDEEQDPENPSSLKFYVDEEGQLIQESQTPLPKVVHELNDEVFTGAVWAMAVPPSVIALAEDIQAWQAKNGTVDSVAMSPFTSESFGGYSYSKSGGSTTNGGSASGANTWQGAFANRLNMWRKI